MNNRLEQFVRDHREEFDSEEPDMKIWDKIQLDLDPPATDKGESKGSAPVVPIKRTWMSAAAAIIVLLAGSLWFFTGRHSGIENPGTSVAVQQEQPKQVEPQTAEKTASSQPVATDEPKKQLAATTPVNPKKEKPQRTDEESAMDEEMYHYARLVEIKHQQLKTIEKDEPMLYKQFSSDVNKLDSVYHGLQHELPTNPNREQLLEAMLQNLQLQMQLLTHQLDIVKQINHSKKKAYEKAYKTI